MLHKRNISDLGQRVTADQGLRPAYQEANPVDDHASQRPATIGQPIETERQAADSVRHITASPPGAGAWSDGCHRLLEDTCRTAGVQLGAYDHRILLWLADWEPSTCAVVAGLIRRAHDAGRAS